MEKKQDILNVIDNKISLFFLLKRICRGESVLRAFLNDRIQHCVIAGKTIDIGGGQGDDYISFIKRESNTEFQTFDQKSGNMVDFESDKLPFEDYNFDTVLLLNVMEHIFNYQHLSNEVFRVTKSGGTMIGFTPFLMRYHGDPNDYFRYTGTALKNILEKSGWSKIKIEPIGMGPFMAALHQFLRSFPKILRVPLFLLFYGLDKIFVKLRPHATSQYVLGYYFKTLK